MKKKALSIILTLAMILSLVNGLPQTVSANGPSGSWMDFADSAFDGGDGSSGNPFQIASAEQLAYLSGIAANDDTTTQGKYYILTNDIDLSAHYWVPVAFFKGNLDGQNYTISGLTINSSSSNQGLFGTCYNAVLSNIYLSCSLTTTGSYAGALIGVANYVTITHCHTSGSVTGFNVLGGLIGIIDGSDGGSSTVQNSSSSCAITATTTDAEAIAGGLLGMNYGGSTSFIRCFASGDVTGFVTAGGILGFALQNGGVFNLTDSYSTGAVHTTKTYAGYNAGGILAAAQNHLVYLENVYQSGSVTSFDGSTNQVGGITGCDGGHYASFNYSNVYYNAVNPTGDTTHTNGSAVPLFVTAAPGVLDMQDTAAGGDGAYDFVATLNNGSSVWTADENTINSGLPVLLWQVCPTVRTGTAASITASGAALSGEAVTDGGFAVSARGIVLSTSAAPTITDVNDTTIAFSSGGVGSFSVAATGLSASTTYYYRAYAVNDKGVSYGSEHRFTTDAPDWTALAASSFDGGDGSEGNPFQIASAEQLAYLAQLTISNSAYSSGKYFILTSDIDLSGHDWTPIALFSGSFDGQNHVISDLNIDAAGDYQGLIAHLGAGAEVSNLKLEDCQIHTTGVYVGALAGSYESPGTLKLQNCHSSGDISAYNFVGGLLGDVVGTAQGASRTITSCSSACSVTATAAGAGEYGFAGGLIGRSMGAGASAAAGTLITGCCSTGSVSGKGLIGGLVGWTAVCAFNNCYATGAVTDSGSTGASGLIGYGNIYVSVTNCYAAGSVSSASADSAGGVIGGRDTGSVTSTNSYYNSANPAGVSGIAYAPALMQAAGFTETLNTGTTVWCTDTYSINGAFPVLVWQLMPSVTTTATAASVTTTSAVLGGSVSLNAGSISERGVVVSTAASPDITDPSDTALPHAGANVGAFTVSAPGLQPGTTYYFRAYATNGYGTAYGSEFSFTTSSISAAATPASPLTEANLNTNSLNVTLSGTTFRDTLSAGEFGLNNAPSGLSIESVTRVDATHCTVSLVFNGTDFDTDVTNFSLIIAGTQIPEGVNITSNALTIMAVVEDCAVYMYEDFDGTVTGWNQSGTAAWNYTTPRNPTVAAHSGATVALFNSYSASNGNTGRLYQTSGCGLPAGESYRLSFWMYHDTGWASTDRVEAQISVNGGASWVTLGSALNRYDGTNGWAQVIFDISAYAGQADVRVAFLGTSGYGNNLFIDDVAIQATTVDPLILEGAATSADGTAIVLTLNKTMANPDNKHGQFTVTVNGSSDAVTAAVLDTDSTKLKLTLTTPVVNGDTVNITYSQGSISASDGSLLLSFSNQAVSNNVLQTAITDVATGTSSLPTAGGTSVITVSGTGLSDGLTVTAFNGASATTVTGTTTGNAASQTVTLTFPANTTVSNITYTIKASLDGGSTWSESTAAVTVAMRTKVTAIGAISGTPTLDSTLSAGALTPAGATVVYQWMRADTAGGTYTNITGAKSSTYTLTSADMGKYIKVKAAGTGLFAGTVLSAAIGPVTAELTLSSLTPSKTSPQAAGTTIRWTATAGGAINPQYNFAVYDVYNGSTVVTTRGWSTTNYFDWKPTDASTAYRIRAYVRETGSTAYVSKFSDYYTITAVLSIKSITPDKSSPQTPGTVIRWTATAGGATNPQYNFAVYKGSTVVSTRGWSTANYFDWTPLAAGSDYRIRAYVREAGTTAYASEYSAYYTVGAAGLSISSLTPSKNSPQVTDTTIRWTAEVSGATNPQYNFAVYKGSTVVTTRGWSTTNYFDWKPLDAGTDYRIRAYVRETGSTAYVSKFSDYYTITAGLSISSITSNKASPQAAGTVIRWTATSIGATTPQYNFVVYKGSTVLYNRGWTATNYFNWTPTEAGSDYRIRAYVRETGSTTYASKYSEYYTVS